VTSMAACRPHGQEITFDQMLNCEHEMAPGLDKLTMDSPAPLLAARTAIPRPAAGIVKNASTDIFGKRPGHGATAVPGPPT